MKTVKFKIEKRFYDMIAAGEKTAEIRNDLKELNEGDEVELIDVSNGERLGGYIAGTIYHVAAVGDGFGMIYRKRVNRVLMGSILNGIGVSYHELKKYCPRDFYKIEIRKLIKG